jgi:hypothetical protein
MASIIAASASGSAQPDLLPWDLERPDVHATDLGHVAQDRDAEFGEQPLADRRHRDPGSRFPRAGALEHVADVVMTILHGPRQIGMAGTRAGHGLGGGPGRRRVDRHRLLPVLPITIADGERDRAAEGKAPADAGGDVGLVLLDLHPAAASVPALAAAEIPVDVRLGER